MYFRKSKWAQARVGRVLSRVGFMLLVRADLSCIPLVVVALSCLFRTAYQRAHPNTSSLVCATVPPCIQEFDVGLVQRVCSTLGCRPMDVTCSSCHGSDAVQKVLTPTTWLRSRLQLRRFSGQRDRPLPSDWRPCFERGHDQRLADQHACVNTSLPASDVGFAAHLRLRRRPDSACSSHAKVQPDGNAVRGLSPRRRARNKSCTPLPATFLQGTLAARTFSVVAAFAGLSFQEDETLPCWFCS